MTYTYRASVEGEDIKESNSWNNIIKYAKKLAKENIGRTILVKHKLGHNNCSFIWSIEDNDIIPS